MRLPDEWEWQQAATGGDDENVFPWGADWDAKQEPWRANTFESRLGRRDRGRHVPGRRLADGRIRTWRERSGNGASNKFDEPDVTRSRADDFDSRVLRGGSWATIRTARARRPQQVLPGLPGQLHRLSCGVFVPIFGH